MGCALWNRLHTPSSVSYSDLCIPQPGPITFMLASGKGRTHLQLYLNVQSTSCYSYKHVNINMIIPILQVGMLRLTAAS